MTLKQPDPSILQGWAQPAASIIDCAAEKKQEKTWLGTHEVGAGPFSLVSYQPNKQMVLQERTSYTSWAKKNGLPYAKSGKIVINFINSDSTLLLQARSGAANVTIGLAKNSVDSLRNNKNVKIGTYPTTIQEQLLMPWDKAPWNNKKFREAMTYAVPYQQILSKIAYGYGKLYYGPLPPLMQFYNSARSTPRAFSLVKAKALVKAVRPVDAGAGHDDDRRGEHGPPADRDAPPVDLEDGRREPHRADAALRRTTSARCSGSRSSPAIRYDGPGVIDAGYYLGYDMRTNVVGIGKNINLMSIPAADKLLDRAREVVNPTARGRSSTTRSRRSGGQTRRRSSSTTTSPPWC